MANPEPKTPGLFPIGGVARLARRKRALDLATFGLTVPLAIAVFADVARGPAAEPPEWVLRNLGGWTAAYFFVLFLRWRWLRCPDCGKGFSGVRGGRLFSPLPAACGGCGLALSPVVEGLREARVGSPASEPNRTTPRTGWIMGFAVIAGAAASWIRSQGGITSGIPPIVSGVLVAGFVLFFGFAARRRTSIGRMCVSCGRMGSGEKYCESCGALRIPPAD